MANGSDQLSGLAMRLDSIARRCDALERADAAERISTPTRKTSEYVGPKDQKEIEKILARRGVRNDAIAETADQKRLAELLHKKGGHKAGDKPGPWSTKDQRELSALKGRGVEVYQGERADAVDKWYSVPFYDKQNHFIGNESVRASSPAEAEIKAQKLRPNQIAGIPNHQPYGPSKAGTGGIRGNPFNSAVNNRMDAHEARGARNDADKVTPHQRYKGIMIDASFKKNGEVDYYVVQGSSGKFYNLSAAKEVAEGVAKRKAAA